jgi:MFS family permease
MTEYSSNKLFNRYFILLTLVNFLVSISYSMVSTTMTRYINSMGFAVSIAGTITGMFSVASMMVRPFTGLLSDRMNQRTLLILATAVMGLCTFLYGTVHNVATLLVIRFIHGMAFAFSSTVNMAVIPYLVPEKRIGEGISYFGVAQSVGIAIGPSVGILILSQYSYTLNFSISALIAISAALLAFTIVQMPGYRKRGKAVNLKDLIAKECLIYMFIDIAIASANGLENSMIALYGMQQGIENIGWYFTISAIILCATRVTLGRVADKHGVSFALYPGLLFIIIGFLILWHANSVLLFAAASIIKTLGVGLARPAIQAACLKAVPTDRRGSASSTYYIGSDIGQGTAPTIGGWIVDRTHNRDYGIAFAWYTVPLFLSAALFSFYNKHRKVVVHEES